MSVNHAFDLVIRQIKIGKFEFLDFGKFGPKYKVQT